jgi:hypothetical protein
LDAALSAQEFKPLAHVLQSVSATSGRRSMFLRAGSDTGIKSASIVLNCDIETFWLGLHVHANTCCSAMFESVIQRFLKRQEKIVTGFGGERVMWQSDNFIECLQQISGSSGNRVQLSRERVLPLQVAFGTLAHEGDFGQLGTNFIVHVPGNADALTFHGLLCGKSCKAAAESAGRNQACDACGQQ